MKKTKIKKIVIVGPESTGKSTLCEQLAQHYNTNWCPEFAREYLLTNGMNYTYSDLLKIAKGQLAMEDEYTQLLAGSLPTGQAGSEFGVGTPNSELKTLNSKLLFIDTNMYVMKVWCEFVFSKCHIWITDQISKRKYDLYLLCNTDLPWVKDELREYPDLKTRDKLYHIYKNILSTQTVPWVDINGGYEERLEKAVKAIDTLLKS